MTDEKREDESLIRAYQGGDYSASEALINKYYQYIYTQLRYKGLSQLDAEDATQELCIKLLNSLNEFQFRSAFKTFLKRAINHKAFDYYRHRERNREVSLLLTIFADSDDELQLQDIIAEPDSEETDQSVVDQDLVRVISHCLGLIGHKIQKALVTMWLEGLKIHQIAGLLGLKVGTANGYFYRGKTQLQNCVKKNYVAF